MIRSFLVLVFDEHDYGYIQSPWVILNKYDAQNYDFEILLHNWDVAKEIIAKTCRSRGAEIHFFTHGGTHEHLIPEADFHLATLQPLIMPEKH